MYGKHVLHGSFVVQESEELGFQLIRDRSLVQSTLGLFDQSLYIAFGWLVILNKEYNNYL